MRRINILTWFCLIMTFALTTLGSQAKEVHETAYLEHNSDFITIKFESIDPRLLTNKKILVLLILNTPYDVQLKTYGIALKPILRRQFFFDPFTMAHCTNLAYRGALCSQMERRYDLLIYWT